MIRECSSEAQFVRYVRDYRVRHYRGRVSNFNQSEARKQCLLDSDWSKFETLPPKIPYSIVITTVLLTLKCSDY